MIMKQTLIRVVLFLLAFESSIYSASAFDFSSVSSSGQTLYYSLLSDSTVSIVYPNQVGSTYYSGYTFPSGNVVIPASVAYGGSSYSVVAIGDYAFYGCVGITSITLPTTMLSIGNSSFSQCTGLQTVSMPATISSIGDNAFMGCSQLVSLELPTALTMIGVGTFQGCSSLASVNIGPAVTTIGNVAFEGCSSLTSLTVPDAVTMIGNWAFCNCTSLDSLYLGKSVTFIFQNTFAGCNAVHYIFYNCRNANCSYFSANAYHSALPITSLTQLHIGDSVQAVPQYAFADAALLDTIYIGSNVNSIDNNAFARTANPHYLHFNSGRFTDATFPRAAFAPFAKLSEIVIGNTVQRVPTAAFAGRDSLQHVVFGSSLLSIGDSSFYSCGSLQGPILFPATLTSIGTSAFQSCTSLNGTLSFPSTIQQIGTAAFSGCSNLGGNMIIPTSLQYLGSQAFSDCDSLLSVVFNPSSLSVPEGAFMGCDRLFRVVLSDNVPSIGSSAFRNCVRLSDITLGNSLASIGSNAFEGCIRLSSLTLPNSLSVIGDSSFFGCVLIGGQLLFPSSVTAIGTRAYANTAAITSIELRSSIPPSITINTFGSAPFSTPVYVPCGAIFNYEVADYWENYTNITESAPYSITLNVNDTTMGHAIVFQQPTCSSPLATIMAAANSGFHFLRWSDGSLSNPRLISISSDTAITAIFVSDNSYITVTCNDTTRGSVTGSGLYGYNATAIITAVPNENYHFQQWSDGNTQNPRSIVVTQDSLFSAIFLSNYSLLTATSDDTSMGTVSGGGTYYYQTLATITATPLVGYHFIGWNDGSLINPRQILISQDTTFQAFFAPNVYAVTLSANSSLMGTVSGSGNYPYLTSATLLAVPSLGYHFDQWSDGNTDNPRTLLVSSDTTLTAQFSPNQYMLVLNVNDTSLGQVTGAGTYDYNSNAIIAAIPAEGSHFVQWDDGNTSNPRALVITGNASFTAQFAVNIYTIMVSSSNTSMGTVSGGGSYAHNATVTITATPNTGYHFTQWSDGNSDNPRAIQATQNANYIAQFAINTYNVSVAANNSALGLVNGAGTYAYNTSATIAAQPFYGYHFVQWNDGNTSNPRTFTVTQDVAYTAQFDTNLYTVTAVSNNITSGTVTGSGTYKYLTNVILTANPFPHHHFIQWNDSVTDNPRILPLVCDTQMIAQFQIDSHSVTVNSANPTMGYTLGTGTVAYGSVIYVTATSNYGYHFTSWSDGNVQNPRRVVVTKDTLFTAQFVPNLYNAVIVSSDSTLGAVSGGGVYNYLTPLTLTAVPLGNSRFVGWSDGNTDNPRTLLLTKDTNLVAQFVINHCLLDCQSDNPNMGVVSGSGTYDYMSQVAVLATALVHHHFVGWSDGLTTNPRLVTLVSDTTLIAYFEQDTHYSISVSSNDPTRGTVTGSGRYYYGDRAELAATPKSHCHFAFWSDGNTSNPRYVSVIADASYEAVFMPDMFNVNASSNHPEMGAVYGSGQYEYASEAVLTAVPFPGYSFRSWNDGNTDNPRTLVVVTNVSYQATFYDMLGIEDPDQADALMVQVSERTINISGLNGRPAAVYDVYGRRIALIERNDDTAQVNVLAAGVYLVEVPGAKAVKVVVF